MSLLSLYGFTAFWFFMGVLAHMFYESISKICQPPLMSVLLFVIALICFQMNVSAQQASAFRLGQAIASPQTARLSGLAEVKITSSSSELNRLYPRYSPRGKAKDIIFNQNKNWFTGKVYDSASTWNHWVEIKRDVSWDAGHKHGHKFADAQKKAYKEGWTRKEWKKYQTNPRIYQPELPGSNRGHKYELTFLEKTQKNVLGAAGKTAKIIGKAVPVLGSAYVVYDTYSIESRYYRGEIDNYARLGSHGSNAAMTVGSVVLVEGTAVGGGVLTTVSGGLLVAPEPVFTKIAGAALLAGGYVYGQHVGHMQELCNIEKRLDQQIRNVIARNEEKVRLQKLAEEIQSAYEEIHYEMIFDNLRKIVNQ